MATKFYADRGFATINGNEVADLKTIKWTVDDSVTRVDHMTRNHRSSGWKKGNRKVTGSFEFDVPNDSPKPDFSFLYGREFNIIATVGETGERFSLIGVVQTTQDFNGSVGDAGKSIAFEARDAVNENGESVNASLGF